eukprot:TRINITY_DN56148_c0_g1_i1.p1 TRINITY_DN56148_c0_g1~~TRINITY_DN56148_c0_g1_i1.p1  ORF type:complete len:518 (+),score=91.22 TRINITY_DN56148_c0_g1_i1:110-1663(+)
MMQGDMADEKKDDKRTLRLISRGTMAVCIVAFTYLGSVYNLVFLSRVLPALGKDSLVPVLAIMFNALLGLTVWSYIQAHCADPGRVPDSWRSFVKGQGDMLLSAPARPEWQPGKATWCKKCNLSRPERAHHCTICQACVLRMDHHCPWIGNCVGFKNQKYFLLLAGYGCMGSAFGFLTVLPVLVEIAVSPLQHVSVPSFGGGGGGQPAPGSIAVVQAPVFSGPASTATTGAPVARPALETTTATAFLSIAGASDAASTTGVGYLWSAAASTSLAPAFPFAADVTATTAAAAAVATTTPSTTVVSDFWRTLMAVEPAESSGAGAGNASADSSSSSEAGAPDAVAAAAGVGAGAGGLTAAAANARATHSSRSEPEEPACDGPLLFGFGVLSCLVATLLGTLLSSHFPLALSNLTTIEENYENMPNPFDHGGYMKNLAQTLGHFGVDWFLPVAPFKPISDGVSYPRPMEEPLPISHGMQPEDIWRLRYASKPREMEMETMQPTSTGYFFEPISRWWQGAF